VYRRAELSRTFVLVVALLLATVSTGTFARALRIPIPKAQGIQPTRSILATSAPKKNLTNRSRSARPISTVLSLD
jgi:hypothetical protein